VTRVAAGRIYPRDAGIAYEGAVLYRNLDREFLAALSRNPPERKIPVRVEFEETPGGFRARAVDSRGIAVQAEAVAEKAAARSMEKAEAAVRGQFARMGGTHYTLAGIEVRLSRPWMLRAAMLNGMRRELVSRLEEDGIRSYRREEHASAPNCVPYPGDPRDHRLNVSNRMARRFYERHGVAGIEEALEFRRDLKGKTVLTSRACVRRRLGLCPRTPGRGGGEAEPLFLVDAHRKHRIEFDCGRCEMRVVFLG
jgi:putative protease